MKKILKNKYYILAFVFLIVAIVFYLLILKRPADIDPEVTFTEPVNQNLNGLSESDKTSTSNLNANTNSIVNSNLNANTTAPKSPGSVLIKMSFLSQAPFANWDALHEDACEEASLIMVHYYYNKASIGGIQQGEDEIQNLIKYETENSYSTSITLSELSNIAAKYYNMNSGKVISSDKASIIAQLDAGRPVIVPAAGKILDNPNFKNGGPNYHMLVIKGYDKNGFITNDPGTRKGEGFRYTYSNLFESIHDWNPENINNGAKQVLVFD